MDELAAAGARRLAELGLARSALGAPGALACALGYSDFLFGHLTHAGPAAAAALLAEAARPPGRACLAAALEREPDLAVAARRALALVALRELAGLAPLRASLLATSFVAEQILARALGPDAAADSGALVVFGLGKLGGRELNFYSDLDLVFAHTGAADERGDLERVRRVRRVLARLEGGFRIDLRLRPFGGSGPLVMGLGAMEAYFHHHGREWERYAWVKARAVAGDRRAGRQFLARLHPFVYRRYLDYHAIEALREMKRQIAEEAGASEDDLKRGPGGIREIEFVVQAFQLVRGGRARELSGSGLHGALAAAGRLGLLPAADVEALRDAYLFLRCIENRLQMHSLTAVHRLPEEPARRRRLAGSLGYPAWRALAHDLSRHRNAVRRIFESVFGARGVVERGPAERLWLSLGAERDAVVLAGGLGFADPQASARRLAGFKSSRPVRLMSARGRVALDRAMPGLLAECAAMRDPDAATARLLELIAAIVRRSAYIALLAERPAARRRLAALAGRSPWIARRLAATPAVLDELLDPRASAPAGRRRLAREFAALASLAAQPDVAAERLRELNEAQRLKIAAGLLDGSIAPEQAERELTLLAELSLRACLARAAARMRERHGTLAFELLALGYGKLGSRELGLASDLDLVFVYEGGAEPAPDGLAADRYLARLAQRAISQLSLPTATGGLYEVDTRLRPEGAAGLLLSRFDAWRRYQDEQAWIWERQALLRARPVAGSPVLARRFGAARLKLLTRALEPAALREEIVAMRRRVAASGPRRTGSAAALVDGEFLAAYWLLGVAARHPQVVRWTRLARQLATLAALGVEPEAPALAAALAVLRAGTNRRILGLAPASGEDDARALVARLWARDLGPADAPV